MADFLCACPNPVELPSPIDFQCADNWDQIQKMFIFRKAALNGLNWFSDQAALLVEANWDTLLAESGDDKMIVTPFLHNFIIPQSEAQTEGGNDNTTINGIPTYSGEGFTDVTTPEMKGAPSAVIRSMKDVGCETGSDIGETSVEAIFVSRGNKIIYNLEVGGSVPRGFPIYNLSVSDSSTEGINAPNKNRVSFSMAPAWSNFFQTQKAGFQLLTKTNP